MCRVVVDRIFRRKLVFFLQRAREGCLLHTFERFFSYFLRTNGVCVDKTIQCLSPWRLVLHTSREPEAPDWVVALGKALFIGSSSALECENANSSSSSSWIAVAVYVSCTRALLYEAYREGKTGYFDPAIQATGKIQGNASRAVLEGKVSC